jgi:hypothetical protein
MVKKQKVKVQIWCVWVERPLSYVEGKDLKEARRAYLRLLRDYPQDIAVLCLSQAKARGLCGIQRLAVNYEKAKSRRKKAEARGTF